MKFIVVGYHGIYSSMGQWVADVLRNLGHEVKQIDRFETIPIEKAVYFFVDCSEDFSGNIPEIPYPKVCWLMDTHMPGGLDRALNLVKKCDLVFSSNYEHGVKLLETVGITSYLMPITYRRDYFYNSVNQEDKKYDIVMIGHPNSPQRVQLWEVIQKLPYKSFCGSTTNLEDYSQAMCNAKIVINQPTEPWDIILNNRFFEAMGCGALLLQKKLQTSLIEKLGFEQGKDFLYWKTMDELPSMLDLVLKNYNNWTGIIESGHLKATNYEMNIQMQKMESLILSEFYDRL